MLHVFLVDIGIMLKFDTELAANSVGYLMEAIQQTIFVPTKKQVLLSAHGVPLDPSNRVASYVGSGTENLPFYLFSRTTIDSPVPPSPSFNLGSEASLKEEVEKCLKMKPGYETLVARAKLAAEFQRCASEIGENCENLVNDQILQKNGWLAAIANLDHITDAFKTHVDVVEECFQNFLIAQVQCKKMLQSFQHVFSLLQQLPLLPCLCKGATETPSLLEWISNHDQQSTIQNLLQQCEDFMKQSNTNAVESVFLEAQKILDSVNNVNMKEIKGLTERLASLEGRVTIMKQLIQDQADMAQGFLQNQMRAEHIGDPSVLPDLCASHQKQLIVLRKNHHQIRENRNLCARAKDELSTNLHTRLRWVTRLEKLIFDCDSKLLAYHTSLKRIKKRLDIFEQVYEAPKMYVLAVLEVLRRKNFSLQFTEWTKTVSESSIVARTEELSKRDNFKQVFGNHFVKNLFPGLDQWPQPFAEEQPTPCDVDLPDVSVEDIKMLQHHVPDLMSELSLSDSLETSIMVRNCLSQSNLTKLIDPKQNKSLEETLQFREQALVENDQLTMSVLKREMSSHPVEQFPLLENVNYETESPSDNADDENTADESEFEPASLRSLSEDKKLIASSDSDMLFHSAELDFSRSNDDLSPVSGISSSSPIAIKGCVRKISRESQCRSLSPKTLHPPKENVFSLPNIHQGSMTNLTYFTQDMASSINSSRSLSDAIKSTEVARNVSNSAELLKHMKCNVKQLNCQLSVIKEEVKGVNQSWFEEFTSIKRDVLSMVMGKVQAYLDVCVQLAQVNTELDAVVKGKQVLCSEHDSLKLKYDTVKEELKCTKVIHEAEKKASKNIHEELTKQCEDLRAECESLKRTVGNLQESVEKNSNVYKEHNILQTNLDSVKFELGEKEKEIKTLKGVNDDILQELSKKTATYDELVVKLENEQSKCTLMKLDVDQITIERNALKTELDRVNESTQKSIDEHLEHVSTVNVQIKNLRKVLAEREAELGQTLQMKDSLETQKQTNFNAVFNKIKKEKDNQIKDLELKLLSLKNDNQTLKHRNENLILEINMHKEAYTQLKSDLKKVNDLNANLQEKLTAAINENRSSVEKTEKERIALENNIKELHVNIEELKKEKLRVMQELKTQYDDELEKEKASLLIAFELQKSALEECGKSDHDIRSSTVSIEEGIDELEIDRLQDKVKTLEAEIARLKRASFESASSSPKSQRVQRTSELFPVEKLALRNLDVGSFIILCYDDTINQYTALNLAEEKYFLHPESFKTLAGTLGKASERRPWLFAYITEKEYCLAKKSNNKFNLPINTYFSRIHVKPYTN